jgi:hypothetical protein
LEIDKLARRAEPDWPSHSNIVLASCVESCGGDFLTEIAEDEQYERDFDWFCVDEAGEVGHFTTAGFKKLPRSVERSAEDRDVLEEFFERQLKGGRGYQVDANLSKEIPTLKSGTDRYLRGFVGMADRGLYSFDIETYLSPGSYYFRVAVPLRPLHVEELPRHIQDILGRTQLKGRLLKDSSRIIYEDTVAM